MSALGSPFSGAVSRNRSATVAVALARIDSHTAGRQATTSAVRRIVSPDRHEPVRDVVEIAVVCDPPSRGPPSTVADCASSVSIWSIAITEGPASATRREMSRTHSCGVSVDTPIDQSPASGVVDVLGGVEVGLSDVLDAEVVAPSRTRARRVCCVWRDRVRMRPRAGR